MKYPLVPPTAQCTTMRRISEIENGCYRVRYGCLGCVQLCFIVPTATARPEAKLLKFQTTAAARSARFLLSSIAIEVTPARPPSCMESTAVLGTRTIVEFSFNPS
jgi:hypothetical protein